MTDTPDIVVDLWHWASSANGHRADERGFCELCSLRMPCDISEMVADLQNAADEIVRLRAAFVEAEECAAEFAAAHTKVMEAFR